VYALCEDNLVHKFIATKVTYQHTYIDDDGQEKTVTITSYQLNED